MGKLMRKGPGRWWGAALLLWAGCSGGGPKPGAKVIAPADMPDICQDLDFNRDVQLRKICGVKTRNYMAYRNVPEHRNLLQPKGGKLVKKGRELELRLENTLPASLPVEFQGKIFFDEKLRRTFIRSRMDYCEFFPENADQSVKVIRLDIPFEAGGEASVCYTVEAKAGSSQRKAGYAGRLEPLDCADFQRLKLKSGPSVRDSVAKAGKPELGGRDGR